MLAGLAFSTAAAAESEPVVVELFTSQGCQTCPGAVEVLGQISKEDDDVITLIWSVDYWDYLGWEDTMAIDASVARQRAYNARLGEIGVYTPEAVINGVGQVVGTRVDEVRQMLASHRTSDSMLDVRFAGGFDDLRVIIGDNDVPAHAVVSFVWYRDEDSVRVNSGENQGSIFHYRNVVRSLTTNVAWDAGYPIDVDIAAHNSAGGDCVAVLITDGANGPIIGAAKIRFSDIVL